MIFLDELKRSFSPEFLNRIDEFVVFHSLEKEHLLNIVDILIRELNERLAEQRDVQLEIRRRRQAMADYKRVSTAVWSQAHEASHPKASG